MTPVAPVWTRRRAAILVPTVLGTLLSGCGSSSHQGATATTSTTTRSAAQSGTTTQSGSSATVGSGPSTTLSGTGAAVALQQGFVSVVAKVRPQVVEISTDTGLGSGVIFDANGDIVTNDHVVGNSTTFQVTLYNGQSLSGTLVGAYPPDDLAVIRVSGARNLSPAVFGDSGAMQIGDIVFALGNPLGLASSVTQGIVSYNGRAVSEGNGVELPQTIQTSAPINPGNSGGALVDLSAEVVGIPTLAAVDQQAGGAAGGIGFAIPSNTVRLIVPQLIATGRVTNSGRAAIGISSADAVDGRGRPAGVVVMSLTAGGAAAKAGIEAGDLITSVGNQKISSLADLQNVLAGLTPGATVPVKIEKQDGTQSQVEVTLGQLSG